MTTLALDTYALVTKLKESGVPEQQAAAQVETLTKAIDSVLEQAKHEYKLDSLATKQDIELLRSDTKAQIELLRSDARVQIAETKADLIRWVVGVGVLQMTLIVGLMLKLTHAI
jgi:hypothetical protein